jgi:putative ABC transport system substrate-binding protein
VAPLLQATRTVPVVFVLVPDPVGAGFVDSLARPGGNATGFVQFEYGISGKWLELLKEIAPDMTRVAVLRDPATTAGQGQVGAIQALAPSFGVEATPINVRDAGEIERAIAAFARNSRRPDRDRQRVDGISSRSDCRAGDPAQAAGGLFPAPFCRQRRLDLLWD